ATDDSYLSSIFEYIASLEKEVGKEVYQFIQAVFTNKTAMIMTYGEQLRQEGMHKVYSGEDKRVYSKQRS
ncbi:MAG: hypothetical protein AAF400_03145, partial [Bacteroidota bacterium]